MHHHAYYAVVINWRTVGYILLAVSGLGVAALLVLAGERVCFGKRAAVDARDALSLRQWMDCFDAARNPTRPRSVRARLFDWEQDDETVLDFFFERVDTATDDALHSVLRAWSEHPARLTSLFPREERRHQTALYADRSSNVIRLPVRGRSTTGAA